MISARLLKGTALIAVLAVLLIVLAWPDLQRTALADDTGFQSPTIAHAPNDWPTPERAFSSDGTFSVESGNGGEQGFSKFDFDVPGGAFILGIAVQLEVRSSDSEGCELEVELSSDDGSSYVTSTQTADLTGELSIHTLGGSNDLWSRDWDASDFTDDNFVALIRNVGPGGECAGDATTDLDHIQVNVYFKALTDTDWQPPKAETDIVAWTDGDEAFISDDIYATSADQNEEQGYTNFNLEVPEPALITGIEVRLEAFSEDDAGCELDVRVSTHGGDDLSTPLTVNLTDEEELHTVGGPDDLWSIPDIVSDSFSDENFVILIQYIDPGGGCTDDAVASVDQVTVRVHYKPLDDTGKSSPSAVHEPIDEWDEPLNADASDNFDASGDAGEQQGYMEFDFSIPSAAIIFGIEVQVEAHSGDTDGNCQLQVELSGDNGDNFTSSQAAVLNGSDEVYTLGGLDDLWGETWTVANFSEANFVALVTAFDPGGDCENAAVTGLDHIQVNVIYKEIDDAGFESPSATEEPNDWTSPDEAFVNDSVDAGATHGDEQGYRDFGLSVDDSAAITGIEVRVKAHSSDTTGNCRLVVELSSDDGANFKGDNKFAVLSGASVYHSLGGTDDTWGRGWFAGDFGDDNFVVKVTAVDSGGECENDATTSLDHIEVNVYFKSVTPAATDTPEDTDTPENTNTPTITPTPTITATATVTETPLASDTPTATDTPTPTSTPTITPTPTKPLGDVNDDGFVNAIDALFILQFDALLITTLPNGDSADVNEDGLVNALDAALILQLNAGFISQLPP